MLRGALTRASSSFLSSSSKGGGKGGGKGGQTTTTTTTLPFFSTTGSEKVVFFRPFGGGSIDDDDDDAFWNREGKKVVTGRPTKKGQRLFEKKKKKKTKKKDDDDDDVNDSYYYYGEREDVVDAFLVTGYGRDRPGIYAQFSRAALSIRADVESARLAKLGSDFTITALVSVAKKHNRTTTNNNNNVKKTTTTKKALEDALDAHIDRFTCDVREVPPETRRNEAHARSRGYKKLIIRATNFPGITSRVTETLAKCGLNIEALRMDTEMLPFNKTSARGGDVGGRGGVDGDEMYFCETTVRLIDGAFREETFKREMEKLEDELSCDVDVEDVSDVE